MVGCARQLVPTWQLSSARAACACRPPCTRCMVAGSRPIWPAIHKSPLCCTHWLYGPMQLGAHGLMLCGVMGCVGNPTTHNTDLHVHHPPLPSIVCKHNLHSKRASLVTRDLHARPCWGVDRRQDGAVHSVDRCKLRHAGHPQHHKHRVGPRARRGSSNSIQGGTKRSACTILSVVLHRARNDRNVVACATACVHRAAGMHTPEYTWTLHCASGSAGGGLAVMVDGGDAPGTKQASSDSTWHEYTSTHRLAP